MKKINIMSLLPISVFIWLSLCMRSGFGLISRGDDVDIMCIEKERQALLMIKEELVDFYGRLSSWGNEEHQRDCCKWRGVSCSNRTGHVVRLNLGVTDPYSVYKPLRGNISTSLLELQHLNYLNLSWNDFGGQKIPDFIGSLNKLRYLDLHDANFRGRVPHQLGNLSRLQFLDLSYSSGNIYADKLEWLSHLYSLRHLDLSSINLSEAIDWQQVLSGLPSLTNLKLRYCNLPSVVTSSVSFVNSSKSLALLYLSGNHLSNSIYFWLFHYSGSLVDLDLSNSNLHEAIPNNTFSNMTSLMHLDLTFNKIEAIPESFRNLCRLRTLSLNSNRLTGQLSDLFHNLSDCTKDSLENLQLGYNKLSGLLPDFTIFSSLKELHLPGNKLNGYVPKSIGQLSRLEVLDLSSNSLEGTITEAHMSNLSRLKYMDLSFNSLSLIFNIGWVPPFQLVHILLSGCKMGPHFPKWLQTQNSFSELHISNAGISDNMPNWFWDLSPMLYYLDISHNQIGGMLPDLSLKFVGYPGIDLSFNCFRGSIPRVPPNVTSLILSNNMFSGSISFLCGFIGERLGFLDLSDNQLSGGIPSCFMDRPNLQILNLANNNFSGKIPNKTYCSWLSALDLHNNSLIGEFPSSLQNCYSLKIIDLGNNKLSGPIPAWIGDSLFFLIAISLRSNQFHGSMPIQLCNLKKLQVLDFSRNDISGTIPKCLNNLKALMAQDASLYTTTISLPLASENAPGYAYSYQGHISLVWKGMESKFESTLGLVKNIDLSSNKLYGKIPEEITSLKGLISLNLSSNNLYGPIPPKIGQLNLLNSLDLSNNQLTGEIPESFSQLDSLGALNLSNNNLSGKIPSSTKPQSFDASTYMGNSKLCGSPLPNKCSRDEAAGELDITVSDNEDGFITRGFYVSVAFGFIIGFWGFCGTLLLKKSWRYSYFKLLNDMQDKAYIFIAVNMSKFQRQH